MNSPTFRGHADYRLCVRVIIQQRSTEREKKKVIGPRSVRKSDIAAAERERVSLVGGSGPTGCLLETPTASTVGLSEVKVAPLPRKEAS